jgi:hypothetical protein
MVHFKHKVQLKKDPTAQKTLPTLQQDKRSPGVTTARAESGILRPSARAQPGAGLFGMIISRTQRNKSSIQTILEKWMLENKMIIIITDADVERMLIEKSNGRDPVSITIQNIEDFQLSI